MSDALPFSSRFGGSWSDDQLCSLLAVKATKLENLSVLGPTQAQIRLNSAMKQVVVPTSQMISGIRYLIERATTYCDGAYPSTTAVLSLIYGSQSTHSPDNRRATCITGLAGVGKSVLFDSFMRIFGSPIKFDIPGHVGLELRPCWRMTIRGRAGFSSLILPHFRIKSDTSPRRVHDHAASEAAAQGIALILADEFQFISSERANTMMASLLYRLCEIGPPVIYACNFSMVNALWRRPQQDRDRLLLDPLVIHPEDVSPDWEATVSGLLEVAEEFSGLNNESTFQLLHDYTFGIKRSLQSILSFAYAQMRKNGETMVTAAHVSSAYHSVEYAAMREDVEILFRGKVTPSTLRKDLSCPLVNNRNIPHQYENSGSATSQTGTISASHAALLSMLTPEMRTLVSKLDSCSAPPEARKGSTQRKPPPTFENLLGGAERFTSRDKKDR